MKKLITFNKKPYSLLVFLGLCTIPNTSHCAQPTKADTFIFGFVLGAGAYVVYSLAKASSESTTRMRAADEQLARQRQVTENIRREAGNGDHQTAQTLFAQNLLNGLDPRMQAMAQEGKLTHISFSKAMLAQDLLRTRQKRNFL